MARKVTQIYLRGPKYGIKHASSGLRVYGMDNDNEETEEEEEGEEGCYTKFAKFCGFTGLSELCGCTTRELCGLMMLYAILLMVFVVLLILKIFLHPPLSEWSFGMFVPLPLGVLINLIAFSILFYAVCGCRGERKKSRAVNEGRECLACGCNILSIIVLWLIGWGMGVLAFYLANSSSFSSLGERIGAGFVLNLGCSIVALILLVMCFCLPECQGK